MVQAVISGANVSFRGSLGLTCLCSTKNFLSFALIFHKNDEGSKAVNFVHRMVAPWKRINWL